MALPPQAPHGDQARQGMLDLVAEELLREPDAGLDLALRWLTALAVAHCRPRPEATNLAACAAGGEPDEDTDMADAAGDAAVDAEDSSGRELNGVQGHQQVPAAADGAASAAAKPTDLRGRPANSQPSEAVGEAGTADQASQAGTAQPWGGLAGSPYEAALLALVKACRWREEALSVVEPGCTYCGPLCCQVQGTMLTCSSMVCKSRQSEMQTTSSKEQTDHV